MYAVSKPVIHEVWYIDEGIDVVPVPNWLQQFVASNTLASLRKMEGQSGRAVYFDMSLDGSDNYSTKFGPKSVLVYNPGSGTVQVLERWYFDTNWEVQHDLI